MSKSKVTFWQSLIIYGSLFLPWIDSYSLGAKYIDRANKRVVE